MWMSKVKPLQVFNFQKLGKHKLKIYLFKIVIDIYNLSNLKVLVPFESL